MTPIRVPNTSDVTTSTACTVRNAVGPPVVFHERGSCQTLRRKVSQITHDHTANTSKNNDVRRDSLTWLVSAVLGFGLRPGVTNLPSCH